MSERRLLQRVISGQHEARIKVDPSATMQDVLEYLRCVFNVRQGSVPTRPDYGMPDLNDVVHAFPDAIGILQTEIRRQITLFEPRLTEVAVRHVPTPDRPLSTVFAVSAVLDLEGLEQRIVLETEVTDDGFVKLSG